MSQGQGGMYRYPSMTSVHSMASVGRLPPGHGYIPRKQKPDKPYGPSFVTIMNRTWRGPGKTYLIYALVAFCFALLFYGSAALYFGHRNVSRMIVLRTEVFGALFIIIALLLTGLTFHFIYKARQASNRWRNFTRFRAEGLYTAAAYNHAYVPEDGMKLATGTYGPRALREIPRPKRKQGRSRGGSVSSQRDAVPPASTTATTERRYEKKGEGKGTTSKDPGSLPPPQAVPSYAAEPHVIGYQPPPPQGSGYQPPPPQDRGYQPPPKEPVVEYQPPVREPRPSYEPPPPPTVPVASYQPPPKEPVPSYQPPPPPPPQDPAPLYTRPGRRQRTTGKQSETHGSVPVLNPLPLSPVGYTGAQSTDNLRAPTSTSSGTIPVYGMGASESEL